MKKLTDFKGVGDDRYGSWGSAVDYESRRFHAAERSSMIGKFERNLVKQRGSGELNGKSS